MYLLLQKKKRFSLWWWLDLNQGVAKTASKQPLDGLPLWSLVSPRQSRPKPSSLCRTVCWSNNGSFYLEARLSVSSELNKCFRLNSATFLLKKQYSVFLFQMTGSHWSQRQWPEAAEWWCSFKRAEVLGWPNTLH